MHNQEDIIKWGTDWLVANGYAIERPPEIILSMSAFTKESGLMATIITGMLIRSACMRRRQTKDFFTCRKAGN